VRKGGSSAPQTKTPQAQKSSDEKATQAPGGVVNKRMTGIEEAAKGAQCMQPPSLYVSVETPLEVWAIPDPSGSAPQTIFYKVPQVQECCRCGIWSRH
jgi:hypothetical protein